MKGKKNDFSMVFFKKVDAKSSIDLKVYQLNYCHDTDKTIKWIESKNIEWDYVNIYHRRSSEFIKREYRNN